MFSSATEAVLFAGLVVTLSMSCGRKHETPGYRIVSLSPAMTEILFSIGAADKVVGVTTFCDFPAEAKEVAKVGDFSHPSIERILALKPDLVIVNLPEQSRIKNDLDKVNINTFVTSPGSLSDLYADLSRLGAVLDMAGPMDSLVSYMKRNLIPVEPAQRKKVYVEISPRPIVTIGSRSFLNDLIYDSGGINIFADVDKDYPIVSQEAVITRDPEIIIVLHPASIDDRIGWKRTRAVSSGQVYVDIDPDLLMRPGPRLIQGFRRLKEIIND